MGADRKDKTKKKSASEDYEQRITGKHLTGDRNPLIVALAEYGDDRKRKARDERQKRDFSDRDGQSSLRTLAPADQSSIRSVHSALNWDFSDAKKEADSSAKTRKFLESDRFRRKFGVDKLERAVAKKRK